MLDVEGFANIDDYVDSTEQEIKIVQAIALDIADLTKIDDVRRYD